MSLDISIWVSAPGVELLWPASQVDTRVSAGGNPKYYARELEDALTEATKVLGSQLKKLYGDIREDRHDTQRLPEVD